MLVWISKMSEISKLNGMEWNEQREAYQKKSIDYASDLFACGIAN